MCAWPSQAGGYKSVCVIVWCVVYMCGLYRLCVLFGMASTGHETEGCCDMPCVCVWPTDGRYWHETDVIYFGKPI